MHTLVQALLTDLRLEPSGVPIYVQVREQVLQALAAGALSPGDQMPTMRQVAVALRIDLNTVRHAYDELERAGAITLERGRGSFVARPPEAPDPQARLDALAGQVLAMARAAGVEPAALAQTLTRLVTRKESEP